MTLLREEVAKGKRKRRKMRKKRTARWTGGSERRATCSGHQTARAAGPAPGLQSLREESQAIVQRKPRLPAGRTGWLLIFLDQLKNLRTYPRGPTPPGEKEAVYLTNQGLCRLDRV